MDLKRVLTRPGEARRRAVILAILMATIALLHYATPTDPLSYHKLNIGLRKLYFLPPVIAAAWFGLRGAIITTAIESIVYSLHAFLYWPGNYMEQANQMGELAGFWVAGLVPGWLFDRQRLLLKEIAHANEETLLTLVSALDMREHSTRLHSQRVREYTVMIADRLGVHQSSRREIAFGALLHDVGKIAVPDRILLKTGELTPDEWMEMRKHPEAGYRIVKRIGFLKDAAETVYAHHEQFDGSGYPRGLKGDAIPLGARIFTVADVFDALTSERPYRSPLPMEKAVKQIVTESGSHFDPAVVEAFSAIPIEELQTVVDRLRDGNPEDALRD